jgi:hypothetical protein
MEYQFADLRFDTERGLLAAGRALSIGRREAALLGLLLAADGRVVAKETLAAALWPGEVPSDDSIVQSADAGDRQVPGIKSGGCRSGSNRRVANRWPRRGCTRR